MMNELEAVEGCLATAWRIKTLNQMSIPVIRALIYMREANEPVRVRDLSQHLKITQQAVGKFVSALEATGIVTCAPGEDRRERHIVLTNEGHEVVRNIAASWRQ